MRTLGIVTKSALVTLGLVMLGIGSGCNIKQDTSDEFRDALPEQGDVALKVPGASGGSSGTASTGGLRLSSGGAGGSAEWYVFTRDVTAGVDITTGVILGGIWALVHSPATTIDPAGKVATWGPGRANALDPVVWRFVVKEVGDKEYDYELDGRPKDSTNDADFKAVLTGHGYGRTRPEHRKGNFAVDNDTLHALDPMRGGEGGTATVTFDLRSFPATIDVELHPTDKAGQASILVTHEQDGGGSVRITGLGDIDTPKDGTLENIDELSRWNVSGAGRADLQLSGGSLSQTVKGSECWGSSFARTYYQDSVNYRPSEGDASTCAFAQAQF